jgi:hypothetical protein
MTARRLIALDAAIVVVFAALCWGIVAGALL